MMLGAFYQMLVTTLSKLIAQIKMIEQVIDDVGRVPNLIPPLEICEAPANAYVTIKGQPLRVNTGMLPILGDDKNAWAALVGHEIAHLVLGHNALIMENEAEARREAEAIERQAYWNSGSVGIANAEYSKYFELDTKAFARSTESQADDLGIQFASKAGYDPVGAEKDFEKFLNADLDQAYTQFTSDHPGLINRSWDLAFRVIDETFDQSASTFLNRSDYQNLSKLDNAWLSKLPHSANAWYYQAKVQSKINKKKELDALEKTFIYSKPSLSKYSTQIEQAYYTMCLDLFAQGYRLESAYCSKDLNSSDRDALASQTFKGFLFVGGDNPPPINLKFVQLRNGSHLITDSGWPEQHERDESFPAWRPISYTKINH